VETLKKDAAAQGTATDVNPKPKTRIIVLTDEAYAIVGRNRNRLYNALGENGLRMALVYMKEQGPEMTGEKDGQPALDAATAELLLQKFYITLDKSSRKNVALDTDAPVLCALDGKPFWPQKWGNDRYSNLGNYRLVKKADGTFVAEALCSYCIRGIREAETAAKNAGKVVEFSRFNDRATVEAKAAELNERREQRLERFNAQVRTREPEEFFRGGAKVTRRGERHGKKGR
jgi:hypothetical protein